MYVYNVHVHICTLYVPPSGTGGRATTGVLGVNPDLCNSSTVPSLQPHRESGAPVTGAGSVCFLLRFHLGPMQAEDGTLNPQ